MHSDWFNGIDILQGRWQYGEKVGYCYLSGLENTFCKWEVYVPLVTEGLMTTVGAGGRLPISKKNDLKKVISECRRFWSWWPSFY
jgi:hypothetical protein